MTRKERVPGKTGADWRAAVKRATSSHNAELRRRGYKRAEPRLRAGMVRKAADVNNDDHGTSVVASDDQVHSGSSARSDSAGIGESGAPADNG